MKHVTRRISFEERQTFEHSNLLRVVDVYLPKGDTSSPLAPVLILQEDDLAFPITSRSYELRVYKLGESYPEPDPDCWFYVGMVDRFGKHYLVYMERFLDDQRRKRNLQRYLEEIKEL